MGAIASLSGYCELCRVRGPYNYAGAPPPLPSRAKLPSTGLKSGFPARTGFRVPGRVAGCTLGTCPAQGLLACKQDKGRAAYSTPAPPVMAHVVHHPPGALIERIALERERLHARVAADDGLACCVDLG